MKNDNADVILWINKADHDLGTAVLTYLHIPEYKDTITFHCQQAVEKYLKAYLIFLEIEFKFSHDLVYLLELIGVKDTSLADFYNRILNLQNYAVEIRYPDETIFLTDGKVTEAIETAKNVRIVVTKKMDMEVVYNTVIDSDLPNL
jgi:HEPN domain-containing protein